MVAHRITLSDEDIQRIVVALRSMSKAGKQSESRREKDLFLAERLTEGRRGNPYMILRGRTGPS